MRRQYKRTRTTTNRSYRRAFLKPRAEQLEPRYVLAAALGVYDAAAPAWFAEISPSYESEPPRMIAAATADFVGPMPADTRPVSRWIVQLTPQAVTLAGDVDGTIALLQNDGADLRVIRGLGSAGQLLVEGKGPDSGVADVLSHNSHVVYFELDSAVSAQALPNDPDFMAGLQPGLNNTGQFGGTVDADIDAPEAWDIQTGSPTVVVGVLDSGVDPTHPDLYLNIWINQGEIRPTISAQLADIDGDNLFTFYDLNNCSTDPVVACDWTAGPNAAFLTDSNGNAFIDAHDLLEDPRWSDGIDTDGNGFVDDFFGWNFRTGSDEPFAPNNPSDILGHGTHVSGTIAAIGDNGVGVAGINWRSSIMALKFLDENNQGNTSDAIAAINYATMMRQRDEHSVNVRVLNNSWGQAGGFSLNLRNAIQDAGEAGILFVAAAGNGNILGQGADNDRTPFYPASYNLDNMIAVTASDSRDERAAFANFGSESVDLAAPGVGVLSTLPGGRFGTANGTSMATPHVSGTAALVWADIPEASLQEVRQSILQSVDMIAAATGSVSTDGRLNAAQALSSSVFAPRAELVDPPVITAAGGADTLITIKYRDRQGLDPSSVTDANLRVLPQWGDKDPLAVVSEPAVVTDEGREITATYRLPAPGGSWDVLDYGQYLVSIGTQPVKNLNGLPVPASAIGSFSVRIADPAVIYVNTFTDDVDANPGNGACDDGSGNCTLRAAIQEANAAAPSQRTIVLDPGTYALSLPPVVDADVIFPVPQASLGCTTISYVPQWSNGSTGDLDVTGSVLIVGDEATTTIIDAAGIDRVAKVYPGATLELRSATVTGGTTDGHAGGGILSAGTLRLDAAIVASNSALNGIHALGGGIAAWDGMVSVVDTTIAGNHARGGGGVFTCNATELDIASSTLSGNVATGIDTGQDSTETLSDVGKQPGGGAILSALGGAIGVTNSTISGNRIDGANLGFAIHLAACGLENCPATGAVGTATLNHVTIADNSSPFFGSVVHGNIDTHASIFADSLGFLSTELSGGNVVSSGFNIVGDESLTNAIQSDTFVAGIRTTLGPLQLNHGPTATHALLNGSPAIDAGDIANFPSNDQKGVVRPQDGDGNENAKPDIGAFESFYAEIRGVVFLDRDQDGKRDPDEPALAGQRLFLDANRDGELNAEESTILTRDENLATTTVLEEGTFVFDELVPGDHRIVPTVPAGWRQVVEIVERVDPTIDAAAPNNASLSPSLSSDGRFVAFTSYASNLVPADNNGSGDIFVFDRQLDNMTRVSVASGGTEADDSSVQPAISADGRFVAFSSSATNLVAGDSNAKADIFVVDRLSGMIERLTDGSSDSFQPAISGDGAVVAWRIASQIEAFDRNTQTATIIAAGEEPAVSADGRFVAFTSSATDLVAGDTNGVPDIFVYDRSTGDISRVTTGHDGTQANDWSAEPSISRDGRFVAYSSLASNLIEADTNDTLDVFLTDRESHTTIRVSVADDGSQTSTFSRWPQISDNGQFVTFGTSESGFKVYDVRSGDLYSVADIEGFYAGDTRYIDISSDGATVAYYKFNILPDVSEMWVAANPNAPSANARSVGLYAGQVLSDLEFGLIPNAGSIHGTCFDDLIANGVHDAAELGRTDCKIFLDANANGRFDPGEPAALTGPEGKYAFTDLAAEQEYRVGIVVPNDSELVLPTENNGYWTLFLPAGGTIEDRDFGLRDRTTGGQSTNGTVAGRLFTDFDGDGAKNGANELGVGNATVFLDLNDDGIRQHDEPRVTTTTDDEQTSEDEAGYYAFSNLGSRAYTVRVKLDETQQQILPLGNELRRQTHSFDSAGNTFKSPQDVAIGDFTGDGLADLAVALYEGNTIAIFPGDGTGGLLAPVNVRLDEPGVTPLIDPQSVYMPGRGPTAVLAGDFTGQPDATNDLAVANSLTGSVTIFLDFTGLGFTTRQDIPVGSGPRALTRGDFNHDGNMDIAVANERSSNISILFNDGSGKFTQDSVMPVVGNNPFALVAVQLNDDNQDLQVDEQDDIDLAIANLGTAPSGTDRGHVSILLNDRNGGFQAEQTYDAQFAPSGITAGDFDGNGFPDLAVTNFLSDTISVLINDGTAAFTAIAPLSAGTGPSDIESGDIDQDGDQDLVIINRNSNDISILRNRLAQTNTFAFESGESIGAGDFPTSVQLAVSLGDVNGDDLLDLTLANGSDNRVSVLINEQVAGAYRIVSDGVQPLSNLDFGILPVNFAPTLDAIAAPNPIGEDPNNEQSVLLTGITAGGTDVQELRLTAISSNTALIANPVLVEHADGASTATVRYEPVANQNGTTVITVTVVDAGIDGDIDSVEDNGSLSRSFTVTVSAVNDPPVANDDTKTTSEDMPVTFPWADLFGNDDDVDSAAAGWSIVSVAALFGGTVSKDDTGKAVTFEPADDFEGTASFRYTLSDGHGGTDDAIVVVDVSAVNDAPSDILLDNPSIAENDEAGVIGDIRVVDPDANDLHEWLVNDNRFIVSEGKLRLANGTGLDAEIDSSITINVTVTDEENEAFDRSFDITVQDVNEFAPAVSDDTASVAENTTAGETIYTVAATDADRTKNLRYSIASGNAGNVFVIDDETGDITLNGSPDHEARAEYSLVINVTDDLAPVKVSTATVTVEITDENEFVPVASDAETSIPENLVDGSFVTQITVTDGDTSQQHQFEITAGDASSVFEINDVGRIFVKDAMQLDHRATPQYTLTVEVSDPFGAKDAASVVIHVDGEAVNAPPTLDVIGDVTLLEDAGVQTVDLTGISAGAGEQQTLRVTLRSDRDDLLATSSIVHAPDAETGTVTFRPQSNVSGMAVMTVTVTDGGLDGELATPADNGVIERSFTLTITPVNDPPTLNALSDILLNEDSPEQAINLSGIGSGANEQQPLLLGVTSSNTDLIPTPTINYQTPQTAGSLRLKPIAGLSGSSVITVKVTDGGIDNDLDTVNGNLSVEQTFTVTVEAVNDPPSLRLVLNEDAGEQTIELADIRAGEGESQPVAITASSSNAEVIPAPQIIYSMPEQTGQLKFTPVPNAFGTALIMVTVTDAGLDGDLNATDDNGATTYTVDVTVNPVNDAPIAAASSGQTDEDHAVTLVLPVTDVDGLQSLSLRLDANIEMDLLKELQESITFEVSGDAVHMTYDPSRIARLQSLVGGQPEQLVIAYLVEDGEGGQANAEVTITVDGVNDWHNADLPLDVSKDGSVSPVDVLRIVNWINERGPGLLSGLVGEPESFLDVNDDGSVSPVDALQIVNKLNSPTGGEGEGVPVGLCLSESRGSFRSQPLEQFESAKPNDTRTDVSSRFADLPRETVLLRTARRSSAVDQLVLDVDELLRNLFDSQ